MTKRKERELPLATQTDAPPEIKDKNVELLFDPPANNGMEIAAIKKEAQRSTKGERQEIFIPVSGFVWLYPEEIRVLDHPAVQRLGLIYQLGQTYLVYRGATHKRIEHAIGTVHVVQRMIDAVEHNSEKSRLKHKRSGESLQENEKRFVRLGALLHDIGHVPAGHTVEDELGLIGKHDGDKRLDILLEDSEGRWLDSSGLKLGELINQEYDIYLPPALRKQRFKPVEIVRLLIRKPPNKSEEDQCMKQEDIIEDRFEKQEKILEQSNEIRLGICRDMIGNTICADILDYLIRDWYHVGKTKPLDDRILQYMEIRPRHWPAINQNCLAQSTDQFVVSIGSRPRIRTDAISSILELLEWRYQLAESVLFHRTKLAATAMLDRALYELWHNDANQLEKLLLTLSDEQMLEACLKRAEGLGAKGEVAAKLVMSLQRRQLFTGLCTFSHYDLLPDEKQKIQKKYTLNKDPGSNIAPQRRNDVLRMLENDFNLSPGSLSMYCPPGDMKAKIAEVKIAVGDEIEKFSKYEDKNDDQLSGGHLKAQLSRFSRLWRVHFFIDRKEKELLSGPMLVILKDAIAKLALGHQIDDKEDIKFIVQRFARELTNTPDSPWHGRKVRDLSQPAAASGNPGVSSGLYPFGAMAICNCLTDDEKQI